MTLEEMQVETAEDTELETDVEVTTETEADPFDDGWGDDDLTAEDEDSDLSEEAETPEETDDANQQKSGDEDADPADGADTDETTAETEEQKPETADQLFELKHFSGDRKVNKDEVIVLAQKGIDYDRKVGSMQAKITEYEEFMKLLAPGGMGIEQLMDITRARLMVASEAEKGNELSESEALLRVQKERSDKNKAAEEEKAQAQSRAEAEKQQKLNESYARFREAYPEVKPEGIPESVWRDFTAGKGDLVDLYARHENKQLKRELDALKQNEKNRARSTGSRKSAGAATVKDAFDEAWDTF